MNNRVKVRVLSILLVLSGVFAGASDFYAIRGAARSRRGELARLAVVRNTRVRVEYDGVKRTHERAFVGVDSDDDYVALKVLREIDNTELYDYWCRVMDMNDYELMDYVVSFFDEDDCTLCINASALHYAISCHLTNAVEYLLDMGVDPDVVDENGMTPLMHVLNGCHSVGENQDIMINSLVKHGALIDLQDKEGNTLLHKIAQAMKSEIYEYLVTKRGANESIANNSGETPLSRFRQQQDFFRQQHINSVHQDGVPDLISLIVNGLKYNLSVTMGAIEYLFRNGADVNVADESGMTPLMHAVVCCFEDISGFDHRWQELIAFLISCGAQINQCDKFGNTALHHAAIGSLRFEAWKPAELRFKMYYELIRMGANEYLENNQSETPEDIVNKAMQPKAPETQVVRLYRRHDW